MLPAASRPASELADPTADFDRYPHRRAEHAAHAMNTPSRCTPRLWYSSSAPYPSRVGWFRRSLVRRAGACPMWSTSACSPTRSESPQVRRRAREDTRGRLQHPTRPTPTPPSTLRTSHFPDPPPTTLRPHFPTRLDTEGSQIRMFAMACGPACAEARLASPRLPRRAVRCDMSRISDGLSVGCSRGFCGAHSLLVVRQAGDAVSQIAPGASCCRAEASAAASE
jgi:hypothetical protein